MVGTLVHCLGLSCLFEQRTRVQRGEDLQDVYHTYDTSTKLQLTTAEYSTGEALRSYRKHPAKARRLETRPGEAGHSGGCRGYAAHAMYGVLIVIQSTAVEAGCVLM